MTRYEACFKKRGSGRLVWQTCLANSEQEAMEKLMDQGWSPGHRHKHNGYELYGGPLICKNKS